MRTIALLLALGLLGAAHAAAPTLVDQTGRSFSLGDLRGHTTVVTFVSAHCSDACPLVNAQFAAAAQRLRAQHSAARLLTITLDPQHDTPAVMRALAARFEADPRYWRVASGNIADVDTVLRAFGVVAQAGPSGYREAHTTFVYVLDASGKLHATLLASTDLTGDILGAVRETQAVASR